MEDLEKEIHPRKNNGDNTSNIVQNDAASKVHHAMESAAALNREKNRQFLGEEFELQEESIESLGDIDIEHESFKLLVRSLQDVSVKNLQAIIQNSGTAKQTDIIRILQKYPSFVVEDYQRSIDFLAKYERSNTIYNMGEFLDFLVRIFDIQSMNELIRVAHQEYSDIENNTYQQETRRFLKIAYLCQNREEYLQWKNFELKSEFLSFLGANVGYYFISGMERKQNTEYFLSQLSSFSEFLEKINTHNFHFYKQAARYEKSYNRKPVFFEQLYKYIESNNFEDAIVIDQKDALYFDNEKCREFEACGDAEDFHFEIMNGEIDRIYKKYFYNGQLIGYTKTSGEKSFLAVRDVVDADGNLLLLKGGMYSIEWGNETFFQKIINIEESPRAISFLRSLHAIDADDTEDTEEERQKAENSLEIVRSKIDDFLGKYEDKLYAQ